jgi:K+-transporting ATPase A subunit
LSQRAGITVQSFLSATTGIVVAIALIRGFARRRFSTIGNFWVDMTRALLYVLLPICVAATLFLVWRGIPQTLGATVGAAALDGGRQLIARCPAASQIAIKLLSGDGGGFFNANSAHPFENPTAEANLVEMLLRLCDRRPDQMTMLAILCIPIVIVPRSAGTLPTNRILFVLLLLGVIVVVGGLTFLPALSLGPAAEQLAMRTGHLY